MGKSKCIKCSFKNEFTTSNGTFYNFDVEFEDGTVGMYASKDKNNPKFKVGVESEFEKEEKSGVKNGKEWSFVKIKPAMQNKFGGGKFDSAGMMVGNAISNATLLLAHGVIEVKEGVHASKVLEAVADEICNISERLKEKHK